MTNIKTDLGKIYCFYNKDTDDFDKFRIINCDVMDNGKREYVINYLDDNYHTTLETEVHTEEEFNDIRKDCVLLKSEGIVSITNVISVENETRRIKDVLAIYFPNNKATKVPDINQPYIVARQGINNIFAEFAGELDQVGLSVSIDTLPVGYALSDFMENAGTLNSRLCHVYKTDTSKDLYDILDNDESAGIFKDLYEHREFYLENTNPSFKKDKMYHPPLNGYCYILKDFLEESGFMDDLYNTMGIIKVDFELKSNVPLSMDDKLLVATLYGGLKIDKAVPLKFDYDINMDNIKMKYFMILDINNNLWIVPYTESANEIDPQELYNLTEERTKLIQDRLIKIVKAYDQSKGIKSDFASNMLN